MVNSIVSIFISTQIVKLGVVYGFGFATWVWIKPWYIYLGFHAKIVSVQLGVHPDENSLVLTHAQLPILVDPNLCCFNHHPLHGLNMFQQ